MSTPLPQAAAPPSPERSRPAAAGASASEPGQGRLRRAWRGAWTFVYGSLGLLAGLSLLAAIPILQFMTLGWLLEVEGRLARGERWRSALPGLERAVPVGSGLFGCGVLLIPFLLLWHYHLDARLLAPASPLASTLWRVSVGYGLAAGLYAALALAAGRGSLLAFATPFRNLQVLYERGERPSPLAALDWLRALRLGHYLSQGVKGFLVAAAWLSPPTLLLAAGKAAPGLGLLGALLLVLCLRLALVAQARVAATGELRAGFAWGEIREDVRRAPLATALALALTLALALPLYLLKIQLLDRDAFWLLALPFLVLLWPTRVASGWALRRARRREARSHLLWRILGTCLALPAGGAYVFLLFFSQYFAWRGSAGLFAHHAFLLPVAFY